MVEYDRRDLVCLYLAAHSEAAEQSPVPPSVTAAGIGDALELGDTAASRVQLLNELATLEAEGLLATAERSITGFDTPRTVYTLTETGRNHAATVRRRTQTESVEVTNGTTEEVPLSEIDRYFEDAGAPLVRALARLTDDGQVPLERHVGESFVDREEPLETVQGAIEDSFTRESQTAVVGGAAGMGKTALVKEAVTRVADDREDLVIAEGNAPAGSTDPYTPFLRAFEAIPDDGSLYTRLADASAAFSPDDPDEVRAQRTALFNDVADGLREAATAQPIVLFLDNLQWADTATLELFAHLSTSIDELLYPVAFVGAYRPDAVVGGDHPLEETLATIAKEGAYDEVALEPLERPDTRALLAGVVGRQRLPDAFVDLVHERTGGNPLFVRETATHLLETGAVDPATETYPTSADDVTLPREVTEQIDQRLARLDEPGRELLRLGAVLGEHVPGGVLAAASDLPPSRRREYEDVLVASRIWEPAGGRADAESDPADSEVSADGGGDLRFISGGVREAVVDRLPESLTEEYHGRVATAFEAVYGDDLDEQAARVAHHYEQAGDVEAAVEHYRRAGDHARDSYANDEAITSYRRALDLGREHAVIDTDELAELARRIADVQRTVGEYNAALETVAEGHSVAADGSRAACRLIGAKAHIENKRGAYDEARATADRQRELAAEIGARDLEAEALRHLGTAAYRQADYETAREHFEAALAGYEADDDVEGMAKVHKGLGNVANERRDEEAARHHYERARTHYEAVDDQYGIAQIQNNLSLLSSQEPERVREYLQEALSGFEAVGSRQGVATASLNLGSVIAEEGDHETGRAYLEDALAAFKTIETRHGTATAHLQLAKQEDDRGRYDSAREHLEQALTGFEAIDNRSEVAEVHLTNGDVARKRGQYAAAREHYERAMAENEAVGDRPNAAWCHNQLGIVAQRRGDAEAAREHFERALEVFEELDEELFIPWTNVNYGDFLLEQGALEEASERLEQAREKIEEHSAYQDEAFARLGLPQGRLALARGDSDAARKHATRVKDRFEDLGMVHLTARGRLLLGRAAAESGSSNEAREHLRGALETFETVGAPQDALAALQHLVTICREANDGEAARQYCQRARDLLADAPDVVADQHRDWVQRRAADLDLA